MILRGSKRCGLQTTCCYVVPLTLLILGLLLLVMRTFQIESSSLLDKVYSMKVNGAERDRQAKNKPSHLETFPSNIVSYETTNMNRTTKTVPAGRPDVLSTMPDPHTSSTTPGPLFAYNAAIGRQVINNTIILIFTDYAAINMTLNFHVTSLRPYNISNFLIVTSSKNVCLALDKEYLPCFHYTNDTKANSASRYGTAEFNLKMNVRTFMILDALHLRYNVLHTDADMMFFADPRPDITLICNNTCDLAPLWDCGAHNAGFLFIRNTPRSIAIYTHMDKTARTTHKDDQAALNLAIKAQKKSGIIVRQLPTSRYQCGRQYYEDGKRYFAGDSPCHVCLVVHNNWIMTVAAKIHRARELHHWLIDGPDRYYTEVSRKYLTYSNPSWFGDLKSTWNQEKAALINALALGQILNRVVVLPRFICPKQQKTSCLILHHLYMEKFDHAFNGQYRESTFLTHPMVPKTVSDSKFLWSPPTTDFKLSGASAKVIRSQMASINQSVIVFTSLYGNMSRFDSEEENAQFNNKCNQAFKSVPYRQF